MTTNILASAAALSDQELLTRIDLLVSRDRETSVELVAHLAALDKRPAARREVPDGDTAAIFDRAVSLLLDKVERDKLGAAARPRPRPPIRPGTDKRGADKTSRNIPREVKRAVWQRDGGQCAFVSSTGQRCAERTFLEFHHVQPHAMRGPATVANISLRCRRHNQYEAELIFGPHGGSMVREGHGPVETAG
jgi:hypothetical protein